MAITLARLASRLGLSYRGDADFELTGIAPLSSANGTQLSFVAKPGNLPACETTHAGCLIIKLDWAERWSGPCVFSPEPYLSYAQATHVFDTRPRATGRVHERACVAASAQLADDVTIDAGAVVEAGAIIGVGSWVGANAVIGADGFGFAPADDGWVKILQLGAVQIGDRVEIGASTTIDRGALTDTVIADDVLIDDQVHVAHNVQIGRGTGVAACTGIAGSTVIGQRCTIAGMVGIADHLTITDDVHVTGQSRVAQSLTEQGAYSSGTPTMSYRQWQKNAVRFSQLDALAKRVRELERQLTGATQALAADEGDPS